MRSLGQQSSYPTELSQPSWITIMINFPWWREILTNMRFRTWNVPTAVYLFRSGCLLDAWMPCMWGLTCAPMTHHIPRCLSRNVLRPFILGSFSHVGPEMLVLQMQNHHGKPHFWGSAIGSALWPNLQNRPVKYSLYLFHTVHLNISVALPHSFRQMGLVYGIIIGHPTSQQPFMIPHDSALFGLS